MSGWNESYIKAHIRKQTKSLKLRSVIYVGHSFPGRHMRTWLDDKLPSLMKITKITDVFTNFERCFQNDFCEWSCLQKLRKQYKHKPVGD